MNLADAILVLHALLVLFNIGVLPVVWVGHFRHWSFVRNFYFRLVHLLLIGVVALESVLGIWCPLTVWEDVLRPDNGAAVRQDKGFVAHWVHELLFYDFPEWVFTIAYLTFFLAVLLTFYWVPPRFPRFRTKLK